MNVHDSLPILFLRRCPRPFPSCFHPPRAFPPAMAAEPSGACGINVRRSYSAPEKRLDAAPEHANTTTSEVAEEQRMLHFATAPPPRCLLALPNNEQQRSNNNDIVLPSSPFTWQEDARGDGGRGVMLRQHLLRTDAESPPPSGDDVVAVDMSGLTRSGRVSMKRRSGKAHDDGPEYWQFLKSRRQLDSHREVQQQQRPLLDDDTSTISDGGESSATANEPPRRCVPLSACRKPTAMQLSLAFNALLILVEIAAFVISGSLSISAMLVDTVVDVVSQLCMVVASHYASRADDNFPVGKARLETIGVIVVACIMTASAVQVVQSCIGRLIGGIPGTLDIIHAHAAVPPHAVPSFVPQMATWMYVLLTLAVGIKLFLYYQTLRTLRWTRRMRALLRDGATHGEEEEAAPVAFLHSSSHSGGSRCCSRSVSSDGGREDGDANNNGDTLATLEVLAQDYLNDILSNTTAVISSGIASLAVPALMCWSARHADVPSHHASPPLLCPDLVGGHPQWLLNARRWLWLTDPIGGILISIYIMSSWYHIAIEQVNQLIGKRASEEELAFLADLCKTHKPDLMDLDVVRAYHSGQRLVVEVEMVVPPTTVVRIAHDEAMSLQHRIESFDHVERAFVHVDYAFRDGFEFEHKVERRLFKGK